MIDDSKIHFQATIAQVKTMADGGLRFVFDAPETAVDTAAALMRARQAGALLEIVIIPVKQDGSRYGEIPTRSEWQS